MVRCCYRPGLPWPARGSTARLRPIAGATHLMQLRPALAHPESNTAPKRNTFFSSCDNILWSSLRYRNRVSALVRPYVLCFQLTAPGARNLPFRSGFSVDARHRELPGQPRGRLVQPVPPQGGRCGRANLPAALPICVGCCHLASFGCAFGKAFAVLPDGSEVLSGLPAFPRSKASPPCSRQGPCPLLGFPRERRSFFSNS